MNLIEIIARRHTNTILDTLSALGVDWTIRANQWQDLFDTGEARDLFSRPMSEDAAAEALWRDLRHDLEAAWLQSLTRDRALAIGNSIGALPYATVELCADVKVPAIEVPARWNKAHPDEKPIYRNDENMLP
jgi:hypothetical protein